MGVLVEVPLRRGQEDRSRTLPSRREDRLQLRHDNADQRLTKKGFVFGLVDRNRLDALQSKMTQLHECRRIVNTTKLGGIPVSQLLKRPDFSYLDLPTDIRSVAPP